jgi:hypothetical protein
MIEVNGIRFHAEWAEDLERRLDDEFTRLSLALDSEDPDVDCVDVTGAPYCGCPTCEQRVYIAIVTLAALEGAQEGLVELA